MKQETILLLHGFTGSGASWDNHASYLRGQGYRVLAPDLPGHGGNLPDDPADYTIEAAAAQLAELLQSEATGPIHLLGYSMGGRLALYFALSYPALTRSLLLESASPGLATVEERAARRAGDEALASRIEEEGIPAFVAFWESLPLWASQARLPALDRQRLHERRLANHTTGLAHSLRQMGTGAQPSLWDRLGELDLPVLLLVGDEDEKFVGIGQRMARLLPQAQFLSVPEAGHTVHIEQPDRFRRALLGFMQQVN